MTKMQIKGNESELVTFSFGAAARIPNPRLSRVWKVDRNGNKEKN